MFPGAKTGVIGPVPSSRPRFIKQTAGKLNPQNTPYRIVNSLDGYSSPRHMMYKMVNKWLPVLGDHEHIDPGIYALGYGVKIAVRQIVDAVPIGNNESFKLQPAFQQIAYEVLVTVTFF